MRVQAFRDAVAQTAGGVAALCLGILLLGLPWFYGGVEQWVRDSVAVLLAISVVAVSVRTLTQTTCDSALKILHVLVPVAGLIAIGSLQTAGGLVAAESGGAFNTPQTIYPADTRLALAALVAVTAAGLIGATVFSREPAFHALLGICLVAAATVAFGGIAMRLTGEDRIVRGAAVFGDPFARFINRNNGAAFLQLGIAAGLALLRSVSRPEPGDHVETQLSRGWKSVDRSTIVLVVATLVALCLAGAVASRSRGGMIAAACTVSVAVPFFRLRHIGGRLAMLLAPPLIAVALLVWLGLSSPAVERFESLTLDTMLADGRIPHWIDASHAVTARPAFGAGLGTYGYAYQEFSRIDYETWFEHADNQYLELLVEAGAAGAAVLVWTWALSAFGIYRGTQRPVERVLIVSLVAGQSAHAVFDFGIVVPAVALMAAVLWAAGVVRLLTVDERPESGWIGWASRSAVVGVALAVAGGLVWAHQEHQSAWAVDQYERPARELKLPGRNDLVELSRTIEGLAGALAARPDDAVGQQILAELLVHRYRLRTAERLQQVDATLTPTAAWEVTRLPALQRTVLALERSGAAEGIDAIRRDPIVRGSLGLAHRHFVLASEGCPRLPGLWIPLTCLEFLNPASKPGRLTRLETMIELFPANAELLRSGGQLAWQSGDVALASRCWKKAYDVQPEGYWAFVTTLATEVGSREAVQLSYPGKPDIILRVAANIPQEAGVEWRNAVSQEVNSATASLPPGRLRERSLAAGERLEGRYAAAADRLRELVESNPADAEVHAELALVLRDAGHLKEAMDESVLAAVLDPRYAVLQRQIESLVRNIPSH